MPDLDWNRLGVVFPEWAIDGQGLKKEQDWGNFTDPPTFKNGSVHFLWGDGYGAQLFFNEQIPSWMDNLEDQRTDLSVEYERQCMAVYEKVLKQLNGSLEIFNSWMERGDIFTNSGTGGSGSISDHLDFYKRDFGVGFFDYYELADSGSFRRPSDAIASIGKLPRGILNAQFQGLHDLSGYVEVRSQCNSIKGEDISTCVRRADELYNNADVLKNLVFEK